LQIDGKIIVTGHADNGTNGTNDDIIILRLVSDSSNSGGGEGEGCFVGALLEK
jgi:hypothetical protein